MRSGCHGTNEVWGLEPRHGYLWPDSSVPVSSTQQVLHTCWSKTEEELIIEYAGLPGPGVSISWERKRSPVRATVRPRCRYKLAWYPQWRRGVLLWNINNFTQLHQTWSLCDCGEDKNQTTPWLHINTVKMGTVSKSRKGPDVPLFWLSDCSSFTNPRFSLTPFFLPSW